MSSISSTEYKYFLSQSANVAFFDWCKAASSKENKIERDRCTVRERKGKTKMDVFLSSALKCVGFF